MRRPSCLGSLGIICADVSAVATITYCTDVVVTPRGSISAEVFAVATITYYSNTYMGLPLRLKCRGTGSLHLDHGLTNQCWWNPLHGDAGSGRAN